MQRQRWSNPEKVFAARKSTIYTTEVKVKENCCYIADCVLCRVLESNKCVTKIFLSFFQFTLFRTDSIIWLCICRGNARKSIINSPIMRQWCLKIMIVQEGNLNDFRHFLYIHILYWKSPEKFDSFSSVSADHHYPFACWPVSKFTLIVWKKYGVIKKTCCTYCVIALSFN
jgi:hypothetical protein